MTLALPDLIARLEAAKEGSRELDACVCEATLNVPMDGDSPCLWGPAPGAFAGDVMEMEALGRVQPYTTSIDAALGLVPEGWAWQVGAPSRAPRATPVIRAAVFSDRTGTGMVLPGEFCEAKAHTAPIALCIAALRARAVLTGMHAGRSAL